MKTPMLEKILGGASGTVFLVVFKSKYGVQVMVASTEAKAKEMVAEIQASQEFKHSEEFDETYCNYKSVKVDDTHSYVSARG